MALDGDALRTRLREARKQAGLTQEQMGEWLGCSDSAVSSLEVGPVAVTVETLAAWAEVTDRPLSWFTDEEPASGIADALSRTERAISDFRANLEANAQAHGLPYPVVELPLLGAVPAGQFEEAIARRDDTAVLPAVSLPRDVNPARAFLLRVKGDSMVNAGILDGDLVLVDPEAELKDGDFVVVGDGGEATVKIVYGADSIRPMLLPANPAYSPLPLAEGCRLLGRVRGVHRTIP